MASSDSDSKRLEKLLQKFRIEDLKKLLETYQKRKSGTKPELMSRAVELINSSPPPPGLERKIMQLYNDISSSIKGLFPTKDNPLYQPLMKTFSAGKAALLGPSPSCSVSSQILTPRPSMSPLTADASSPCTVGDVEPLTPYTFSGLKMIEHPFHEVLSVIRKPTVLDFTKQGDEVIFQLNLPQLHKIIKSNGEINTVISVLLRFCTLDSNSTTSEQPDQFPEGLFVKVNGYKLLKLPVPDRTNNIHNQPVPKPKSYPIDIPASILSIHQANIIQLRWNTEPAPQKSYCYSVFLTRKLSAETQLAKLKAKPLQLSEVSKDLIKKMTMQPVNGEVGEVDLCVPKSIPVSLACPISKTRMRYPCRGVNCKHLQCFDAQVFLQIYEKVQFKIPRFSCPVCNIHLKVNDLCLDGYFSNILDQLPVETTNEIELLADGSWRAAPDAVSEKTKSGCEVEPPPKKTKLTDSEYPDANDNAMNKTIDLDDDEEDNDIVVVEQVIQMPKTSPIPLPYFSLNELRCRCNAPGAGEADEPKASDFEDSLKNGLGLGLGKENEIYLDLD